MKITGAHDFNDFQVAQRHGLSMISIMDERARMTGPIPERYQGVEREHARRMVVQEIEALGLLREIEDKLIAQPHGDRSGVVIEPFLTDQWYVDAKTLAAPAIAGGGGRPHRLRAQELGEDLLRMDAQHRALVHLAPALVGAPDTGLVWADSVGGYFRRPRTSRLDAQPRNRSLTDD